MRILGIDYGDARIGLALSDASATLCGRAWTLTEWNLDRAVDAIRRADVLVVAGTSLVVYPAAGFIDYFRGGKLVIVNLSPTPLDRRADLCIQGRVGEVFDW